jgi:hypothetical protein
MKLSKKQMLIGGAGIALISYILLRQSKLKFIKKTLGDCYDEMINGKRRGMIVNYFSKDLEKGSEFYNHKLGGFVLKEEAYDGRPIKYHILPIERFIFAYAKKLKQIAEGNPKGDESLYIFNMPGMAVDYDYQDAQKGEC